MAGDRGEPAVRKGNRAHKLRRRHKVEDNPMSGGSLRRLYPAVVERRLKELTAAHPEEGRPVR